MTRTAGNRNARRGWLRLTLLICVMCGVGAMHTLGHLAMEHGAGSHVPAHEAAPAADTHAAAAGSVPDPAVQDELPSMDPTSMCLALAVLLLMLVGIAASAFRCWPGMLAVRRPPTFARPDRADRPFDPPSLSRLQVLRI